VHWNSSGKPHTADTALGWEGSHSLSDLRGVKASVAVWIQQEAHRTKRHGSDCHAQDVCIEASSGEKGENYSF